MAIQAHAPGPRAVAVAAVEHRVHGRWAYRARLESGDRVAVSVWPRPGSSTEPATYTVQLERRSGAWVAVSFTIGLRSCRRTIGGARDPDPSPTTMLPC